MFILNTLNLKCLFADNCKSFLYILLYFKSFVSLAKNNTLLQWYKYAGTGGGVLGGIIAY